MRHLAYWAVFFRLVVSSSVFAGGGDVGGNSGHYVDCGLGGALQGGFLLDYLEGELSFENYVPDLGPDSLPIEEKAMVAVERLSSFDPVRASRYEKYVKSFFSKTQKITEGPDLQFRYDHGYYEVPPHCKLRQLVISRPFHPSVPQYLYDERLFLQMSLTHQAGVLLHEAIYAETIALGHSTSESARRFNALISSQTLKGLSQTEYEALASKLFAPQFGPEFNAGKMFTSVFMGKELIIPLRSLLSHEGTTGLKWKFDETLPEWLHFLEAEEKLQGIVPFIQPEEIRIQMTVSDGKKAALGVLELRVKH